MVVICLCSALSKEQGITVVAVCLTYDFFIVHKVNFSCFCYCYTYVANYFPIPSVLHLSFSVSMCMYIAKWREP